MALGTAASPANKPSAACQTPGQTSSILAPFLKTTNAPVTRGGTATGMSIRANTGYRTHTAVSTNRPFAVLLNSTSAIGLARAHVTTTSAHRTRLSLPWMSTATQSPNVPRDSTDERRSCAVRHPTSSTRSSAFLWTSSSRLSRLPPMFPTMT
ncbi:hypothetical protein CTA2_2309 [Colletotrichum tanaceti]|uniref:Uncharacterized protein n=1 Tax=Colletotrichum tanaceti TaxID=1306861 RepID=A0A4U6WZJ2_9PEZI|nr:hypothetical protein CTA2_2309 [Colletotrichum tanaceti]TKW48174.1 hypothetical protein CTA1_12947 [Colletotrichum tanaceti]